MKGTISIKIVKGKRKLKEWVRNLYAVEDINARMTGKWFKESENK